MSTVVTDLERTAMHSNRESSRHVHSRNFIWLKPSVRLKMALKRTYSTGSAAPVSPCEAALGDGCTKIDIPMFCCHDGNT